MKYKENNWGVFFSVQPFWNIEMRDIEIWQDTCSNLQSQVSLMHAGASAMDCVPGVGLIGILFSCDANHPIANCYGVLKGHRMSVPLRGIQDGIFIRLSPGSFTCLFGIPSNEIPAEGTFLEDLLPTYNIAEKMALAGSWDERHRLFLELLDRRQEQIGQKQEIDFAALSQQFGFYDQSHLIQVFKEFSGVSPGCFLKQHTRKTRESAEASNQKTR